MSKIISVENIRFSYESPDTDVSIRALDGVGFDVEKGDFIAVIGRNGSGKSTLAKCLNALLLPSSGRVSVMGMDTSDVSNTLKIRQAVGMVFQNPDNQLVSAIVEDDVAFGPENIGVPGEEIRARVDEALKRVGMYEHRQRGAHLLSGGQKQRVAIAGVLAMKPAAIVLDEATAMLDPAGRRDILKTVRELREDGTAVILITHFMEEAALADRIIVMEAGKIVMEGEPSEIFMREEELSALSLTPPFAARAAGSLRSRGFDIPVGIKEIEDLAEAVCALR